MSVRPSPAEAPQPGCTLEVKVIPNAPHTTIVGWLGSALKIKVHAPPIDGRANDALMEFLAKELRIGRRSISLLRGDKSRQKIFRIEGLNLAEVKIRMRLPS